jgi:hypothetical protein
MTVGEEKATEKAQRKVYLSIFIFTRRNGIEKGRRVRTKGVCWLGMELVR